MALEEADKRAGENSAFFEFLYASFNPNSISNTNEVTTKAANRAKPENCLTDISLLRLEPDFTPVLTRRAKRLLSSVSRALGSGITTLLN